jgi:hypothetical protein
VVTRAEDVWEPLVAFCERRGLERDGSWMLNTQFAELRKPGVTRRLMVQFPDLKKPGVIKVRGRLGSLTAKVRLLPPGEEDQYLVDCRRGRLEHVKNFERTHPGRLDPVKGDIWYAVEVCEVEVTRRSRQPATTQRKSSKVDVAVPLLREVWVKANRPHWTMNELFKAAAVLYKDDARLKLGRTQAYAARDRVLRSDDASG